MKNHHIKETRKPFFEGWYFKHQYGDQMISFIPGIHVDRQGKRSAFIQIITSENSFMAHYPYEEFYAEEHLLYIRMGKNIFCEKGISIDMETEGFSCKGKVAYSKLTRLPYDIMGPFALVPNMECNHGIVSVYHRTKGKLTINGNVHDLARGFGYIEKDWGHSFPREYAWVQCNDFEEKCSIVVSTAHIPFMKCCFQGLIGIVYDRGRMYRFATYNGAKVLYCDEKGMMIQRGKYRLKIQIGESKQHALKAPEWGNMSRVIHEKVACKAKFTFYIEDKLIFTRESQNASFEYVKNKGNISGYFG